jgi:hypothetical protein
MYRLGSEEKPWYCSYRFNMSVDFCIWVLESDGLRVLPFDQHPSGAGISRIIRDHECFFV